MTRERRRKAWRWGRLAESAAAALLRLKGFRILARGYKVPVGEIDIVARRGRLVLFVEVKARPSADAANEARRVMLSRGRNTHRDIACSMVLKSKMACSESISRIVLRSSAANDSGGAVVRTTRVTPFFDGVSKPAGVTGWNTDGNVGARGNAERVSRTTPMTSHVSSPSFSGWPMGSASGHAVRAIVSFTTTVRLSFV